MKGKRGAPGVANGWVPSRMNRPPWRNGSGAVAGVVGVLPLPGERGAKDGERVASAGWRLEEHTGFTNPTGPVKPPPSSSGLPNRFDRKPVETG